MNKIIILLLLVSPSLNAQIQFWGKDDIIEKQFEVHRKEMKIKTAYNYIVGSRWTVSDSNKYNEVFHYNESGQKTIYIKYKTDWASKGRRYKQIIDSVEYTDKGVFKELRRYTPVGNNGHKFSYKAVATHDKKGNIKRVDTYTGYMASEPKNYSEYSYDKKGRVNKITKYNAKTKEKEFQNLFTYNKKGQLISHTSLSFFGGFEGKTVYKITYNNKDLLESYTEFYNEKEEQNKAVYSYDENNRYVLRKYSTKTSYEDVFACNYRGNETIPMATRLDYSSGKGKRKQVRQESLVYKFEYFD